MLYGLLLFIHVIVSVALVIVVLMQSSKGGGLAGTFGGTGGGGGFFGGRGAAPFLVKATTVFAVMFMLTSISLNFVRTGGDEGSVLERMEFQGSGQQSSEPLITDEMPVQSQEGTTADDDGTGSEPLLDNDTGETPDSDE